MENAFKNALSDGRNLVGSWSMAASANVAEALGWVGFDFLTVDLEHAPYGQAEMVECLRAVELTGTLPVVRVPDHGATTLKRALDGGARTLMVPQVESADEARRIVDLTRYPPVGHRGYALMTRASRFTAVADYAVTASDSLCVIAQIESSEALARLEEIASVPGIDALFIGPGDLSANMGHLGNPGAAPVQEAVQNFARRCAALGKPSGTVFGTPAQVARCFADGFRFVAVASDLAFMIGQARAALAQIRDSLVAGTPESPKAMPQR